jgi:hypothetical protein
MAIDITGRTFGRLTAIARVDGSRWQFKCACGTEKILDAQSVKYRKTLSCGCLRQIGIATGDRFGLLTASHYVNHGKNGARWFFQCDCGAGKIIASSYVRSGLRTSCGCSKRKVIARATEPAPPPDIWPFPKWPKESSR